MTAPYDPFGSLGRRPEDMRPAVDPWDTGERIFGSQWDTGEQRALDAEWEAGQRAYRRPPRPIGHPRPARTVVPVVSEPVVVPRRRRRGLVFVLLLVVVLVAAEGWQTWRLTAERDRAAALDQRLERLEKRVSGVFDPESISSFVLPSVFRVRAGEFTGTAFSVGDKAGSGKANLLTNFHVVSAVWEAGGREVRLERGGDVVTARIVKVSRGKDLALLRASRGIRGLKPARGEVRSGQQILVVGAPLGLEDSVTTGVVSAYRPGDSDGQSIQFDAPINPGNSGGPVVNAADEVVGVATAKARDAEGIGLAVPIGTACRAFAVCCPPPSPSPPSPSPLPPLPPLPARRLTRRSCTSQATIPTSPRGICKIAMHPARPARPPRLGDLAELRGRNGASKAGKCKIGGGGGLDHDGGRPEVTGL